MMNRPKRMASAAIVALGALSVFGVGQAMADVESIEVHLGTVKRTHLQQGNIDYVGDYAELFSASVAEGHNKTLIDVDLAQLINMFEGYNAIQSTRLQDSGTNSYGSESAGADIDLFQVWNGTNGSVLNATLAYNGPSAVHTGESSETLGIRVGAIDAASGTSESDGLLHVSLDSSGSIIADLDVAVYAYDAPTISFIEAGSSEWVDVYATLVSIDVPAPGAFALLGVAGFVGRRRRKH